MPNIADIPKFLEWARSDPWGVALAVLTDGSIQVHLAPGADELTEHTSFQVGSITKTFTGRLAAEAVARGELDLETSVGEILLDKSGSCATVTFDQLLAHTSGLPRLPPNLQSSSLDVLNPYAHYKTDDLYECLSMTDSPIPGERVYSNFGYMLAGHLLGLAANQTYCQLLETRIFAAFGLTETACGVPTDRKIPGYRGGQQVPWWDFMIPGAGAISSTISDLAKYVAGCITSTGWSLGWIDKGAVKWHNGGTGGFTSFAAFHRPSHSGVALLANSGDAQFVDDIGFKILETLSRRSRQ